MEPMSFIDHLQEGMNHINFCNAQIKQRSSEDFARVNMYLGHIANMLINAAPPQPDRIAATRPKSHHFQEASYGNGNHIRINDGNYNASDHLMVQAVPSRQLNSNLSAYEEEMRLMKEHQAMEIFQKETIAPRNPNGNLSADEEEISLMKEHQAMERSKKENIAPRNPNGNLSAYVEEMRLMKATERSKKETIDPRSATGPNAIPVIPRNDKYLDEPLSKNGLLRLVHSPAPDAATLRSAPRYPAIPNMNVANPRVIIKPDTSQFKPVQMNVAAPPVISNIIKAMRNPGARKLNVAVPRVINNAHEATPNFDTAKMNVAALRIINNTSDAMHNPDIPKLNVVVPHVINNTSEGARNPDISKIHGPIPCFISNTGDGMRNYDRPIVNISVPGSKSDALHAFRNASRNDNSSENISGPRVNSNAGDSTRNSDNLIGKPSTITRILQRPSPAVGSTSSSSISSILSQDVSAPKGEPRIHSLNYAREAVQGSVDESNGISKVLPQVTQGNGISNDLLQAEKKHESMAERLAKQHAQEELAKKREEEEEKRAKALKPTSPVIVKSSWAGIAVKGVNDEESKPLDMRAQVPPSVEPTRGFVRIGGTKSKALRSEPEADQLRGVFILNPPETMTANDVSTGIHEGALLAIRTGTHPDTQERYFGIIFQWAPSATNFLAVMEEERKKSTPKRFSFIANCVRGTPVPRDEWLLAMEEPLFARRRLTLAQKGLFFTWKRQDIERFCWKHVGKENVQFVHMYNGGNATICFTEVEAAMKVRKILEEMVRNGAEKGKYHELSVGYSKDPCEAEVRFLTSSTAHYH